MPPVVLFKGTEAQHVQVPMDWIEGCNGAAKDFIDALLEERQPRMDLDFARKTLPVALSVYQASTSEHAVDPSTLT